MHILIYDIDSKSTGIEYPLKEAFNELGHTVVMFNWRKYLFTYSNTDFLNRVKDKLLFKRIAVKINLDLINLIEKNSFDLFLVLRGDHIFPETIIFSKKVIPFVVNWNSDDLFNKGMTTKYILESFDKFDIHFSPRPNLRNEYIQKGAKSFEILNWYYRLGVLFDAPKMGNINYLNSICFIGSWSNRRAYFLKSLTDFDLTLNGWAWSKKLNKKEFPNWMVGNPIAIKEMANLFSKTKININILTIENRDTTNLRNFEIAAAGGFQLSERSDQILDLFKEDEEIVCFSSPEELKSKCSYYLKNQSLREKIALAGYNKLINGNNSLVDRTKQIINTIIS